MPITQVQPGRPEKPTAVLHPLGGPEGKGNVRQGAGERLRKKAQEGEEEC
jgi:hypothetical protein